MHCTLSHWWKHAYWVWSHLDIPWTSYTPDKTFSIKINQRGIMQIRNKIELRFLCTALRVIARNMHTKFGVMYTYSDKVRLWTKNAIYHSNKEEYLKERNNVELKLLCTALQVIAGNKHTTFRVICTYSNKVTLRTRNALQKSMKGD